MRWLEIEIGTTIGIPIPISGMMHSNRLATWTNAVR